MSIGKRIKKRRTELGISQRELAEMMGYSNHSTIARIESDKVDIPQSKIVQFAEALETSIAFLMGWEEKIQDDPKGVAELHFEILMDEDFVGMFEDFHSLDKQKRKIVKDLVHSLAETDVDAEA